jgi:cyclophilin family peptidyl-prolyl cis-trans isomerase
MNKMIYAGIAVAIIIIAAFLMFRGSQKPENNLQSNSQAAVQAEPTTTTVAEATDSAKQTEAMDLQIDKEKTYQAVLHTTEGDITIDLNAIDTPITANNFVKLARENFYDNTIFHRVIDGFMIQGGDPTGTGTGGPGYKFDDEPFTGEYTRGTVAMANSGPNTNGSQFFIMHADTALPKNYVIFGKVSEGLEAVDKIATAETTPSLGGENSKPVNPVKITSVDILEQ